jgi:hypothetical protein
VILVNLSSDLSRNLKISDRLKRMMTATIHTYAHIYIYVYIVEVKKINKEKNHKSSEELPTSNDVMYMETTNSDVTILLLYLEV